MTVHVVLSNLARVRVARGLQARGCCQLRGCIHFSILEDLLEVFEKSNFATSRETTRLDYPKIVEAIHISLRIVFPQVFDQLLARLAYFVAHCGQL